MKEKYSNPMISVKNILLEDIMLGSGLIKDPGVNDITGDINVNETL